MRAGARAWLALVACTVVGAAACGGSGRAKPPPPPLDARGRSRVEVDATGNRFVPATVIVDVGTTVTWVNKDAVPHNVEKSADALDFGAPFGAAVEQFGPGGRYSFTFARAGTYPYTCTIHSLMDGKVQVVAKGAAPSAAPARGGGPSSSVSAP